MARTVLSETLKQRSVSVSSKTSSKKDNVIASFVSAANASSSSINSLPPKKLARVAKKVEKDFPEKRTLRNSKGNPNVDEKPKVGAKKGGGEGLKARYMQMIAQCIFKLQQKNGSSRAVIGNQLKLQFASSIGYNEAEINLNVKLALKKGLDEGVFKMAKVVGKGSGSYKLTETELKKLKKKQGTNKPPATIDIKQQTNMNSFITKTPKPEASVTSRDEEAVKENELSPTAKKTKQDKLNAKHSNSSFEGDVKTPESYVLLDNLMDSLRRSSQHKKESPEPFNASSSSPSLRKQVSKGN